jgi:hypothetical protein
VEPSAYIQDDIKLNSRVTANLGLRYERPGFFGDQSGRSSTFDFGLANPNLPASGSQAGYVLPANFTGPIPAGSVKLGNDWGIFGNGQNTVGPRVGFAWQVLPNSRRLVLRGGYGIYYSTFVGTTAFQGITAPPFADARNASGTANATANLANPFGPLLAPNDFPLFPVYTPTTQLNFGFDAIDSRPPITQEYSLNLQTQLARDYLLEIGYVGSRGTHLVEGVYVEQAGWATPSNAIRGQTTDTLANLPLRLPVEGFEPSQTYRLQTTGNSWYNALQVSLTKRFSHGLQFLASYTYARLLDTEGGQTFLSFDGGAAPGNQDKPGAHYGPASTVRPHRLVVSFVYDLPKLSTGGFAANVLNNWSLSGVSTVQSGHPLTIVGTNVNNVFGINGYGEDFAEWAPGCTKGNLVTPGSVISKLNNYFNQACIAPYPIVGADGLATGFGNMGTGLVNGPGQINFDLALSKQIPVGWFGRESRWLFRAEFFNAFNKPNFGDPDLNTSDGGAFGVISSTLGNPRVIQFALKYNF